MQSLIRINGRDFPQPDYGLDFIVATFVDSGRNANMEVVGQKIGRDQFKVNNLVWSYLPATTWSEILKEFSGFFATVTIPDMVTNSWVTLKMYPGDRSAKPFERDETTGLPSSYRDCKVNIIDAGLS